MKNNDVQFLVLQQNVNDMTEGKVTVDLNSDGPTRMMTINVQGESTKVFITLTQVPTFFATGVTSTPCSKLDVDCLSKTLDSLFLGSRFEDWMDFITRQTNTVNVEKELDNLARTISELVYTYSTVS